MMIDKTTTIMTTTTMTTTTTTSTTTTTKQQRKEDASLFARTCTLEDEIFLNFYLNEPHLRS